MNSVHDMGGMMGFGSVVPEASEPIFHAEWERRLFALRLAMDATGEWNIDLSRFLRESLPPAKYLAASYYEIWLEGFIRLLLDKGLATADEIAAGMMTSPAKPVARKLRSGEVAGKIARGTPYIRDARGPAKFKPGDSVSARNIHPQGHTRLPRYLRGHSGEIAAVNGAYVFPDSNARGNGEDPQWLYTVRFPAREIWSEAGARDTICADLWEPYLEPL
jgi:nitrile hydratase beta subunit